MRKLSIWRVVGVAALGAAALAATLLALVGSQPVLASVLAQETPTPVPAAQAKAWLGVQIAQLNQQLAQRLGLSRQEGVMVIRVLPDTPAAQAGLQAKDIITAIDGAAVATVREVQNRIKANIAGAMVTVTIIRGDSSQDVRVTLGSRPEPQPKPHFPLGLGFLPELEGIAPQELFNHILGFDLRMTDKNGQPLTVHVVPGTVTTVSDTSLTIDPNGPATSTTYSVTTDTVVAVPEQRISALNPGDKVMVVTVGNSTVTRAVIAARGVRGRAFGFGGHGGMPFGTGGLRERPSGPQEQRSFRSAPFPQGKVPPPEAREGGFPNPLFRGRPLPGPGA